MDSKRKQPQRMLALDTSTRSLTAALLEGERVVAESQSFSERNHSVQLIPVLQALLRTAGWKPADLDKIAAGQGPGSYTGVRIAVTAAKTLAWTIGKPLVGVSSLEALAFGARSEVEHSTESRGTVWIVPLMDARRDRFYTSLFAIDPEGNWTRLRADGIRLWEQWIRELAELASGDADLHASSAAERVPVPDRIRFVSEAEPREALRHLTENCFAGKADWLIRDLHAADVGRLALNEPSRNREEVHRFVPNYTQLAEAEAKLLAKET